MTSETAAPQNTNIQIGLGAQYITDFSFESPNAPQIFSQLQSQPQMGMDVNVMSRNMGDNNYESVLKLKLEAKIANKIGFIVELSYAGLFTLPAELPEEQTKMFLLVEAPRLLFPFARSIITTAIRDGGFPNIALQPIDFLSLYAAQRSQVGTMTAVGAA